MIDKVAVEQGFGPEKEVVSQHDIDFFDAEGRYRHTNEHSPPVAEVLRVVGARPQ